MGTRNLTIVKDQEGQTKVSQYGQWDGYPSGVGAEIIKFLSNKELVEKLKSKLTKVRFLDSDGVDKEFIDEYNKNAPTWSSDPDNRTEEQKIWFSTFITRDLAQEVLTNIANSDLDEILITNTNDDNYIEYVYTIDFRENTLAIAYSLSGVALKVYNLDEIPSVDDFIKELNEIEEELNK